MVPVLLVVGFITWLGVKPLETRLNPFNSDAASDGRLQIWKNVLPLAWRDELVPTNEMLKRDRVL